MIRLNVSKVGTFKYIAYANFYSRKLNSAS